MRLDPALAEICIRGRIYLLSRSDTMQLEREDRVGAREISSARSSNSCEVIFLWPYSSIRYQSDRIFEELSKRALSDATSNNANLRECAGSVRDRGRGKRDTFCRQLNRQNSTSYRRDSADREWCQATALWRNFFFFLSFSASSLFQPRTLGPSGLYCGCISNVRLSRLFWMACLPEVVTLGY